MNRSATRAGAIFVIAMAVLAGCDKETPPKAASSLKLPAPQSLEKGAALFNQYCSPCHPDGGNVSDPQRTLQGSVLRGYQITRPEDIVIIMRNPLSRMIRFDKATISDQDAMTIANYVLTAFK